jgi:ABC-2 type transport system ATP-binding protein
MPALRLTLNGERSRMTQYIIETENLTKEFSSIKAVDGINIQVKEGEIFGLVGSDGAGKSTTIRLLATILEVSGGTARVAGFDIIKQAERVKEKIGYMSQEFSLYGDLSVIENLDFFADIYQVPREMKEAEMQRLLEFARLNEFRNRRAEHLSGGMKQKLALACTLIHEPEILFLDEPTTGVDPVSRRDFWKILGELNHQGVTIFITTPYMDEAERCHRVALMQEGKIILCDTPEHIEGMVQGDLLEVSVSPVRDAQKYLRSRNEILAANLYGQLLQVRVGDAKELTPLLKEDLRKAGFDVQSIRQIPVSMENAFMGLLGARTEE